MVTSITNSGPTWKRRIGALYIARFDVYIDDINALQPDIVFIASENDILTAAGAEGSPDFVVEVLSPKTAHLDKTSKRRVYARSGVDGVEHSDKVVLLEPTNRPD